MPSIGKINLNFKTLSLILILAYLLSPYKLPFDKETKLSMGYFKDSLLNFTELTKQYGYETDEHDAITEDGYILKIFHVVKSKNCKTSVKKTPVLLIHGLFGSAERFLDAGTKSGLGYLLPDACFDLWVGNQRGNNHGRRHTHLDPDGDAEFWDFTAEEMSYYDIPAMMDYILKQTNTTKLHLIGYSQGGSNFFIMCSERQEYCQKAKLIIALAPSAILSNIQSTAFKILTKFMSITQPILEKLNINEVLYIGSYFQEFFHYFCQYTGTFVTDRICGTGGVSFDNYHAGSISYETQRTLFGHFPAGTSVKNLVRYGQIHAAKKFQKYDYGHEMNLEMYGSIKPPQFNMSAVTAPVVIVHGTNDILTVPKDIQEVKDQLPNLIATVKVADPLWTHLDIVYSQYSRDIIFPAVKTYLDAYSDT